MKSKNKICKNTSESQLSWTKGKEAVVQTPFSRSGIRLISILKTQNARQYVYL